MCKPVDSFSCHNLVYWKKMIAINYKLANTEVNDDIGHNDFYFKVDVFQIVSGCSTV